MKPRITLLITDLDNTLYDWVTFFVGAFSDMLSAASDKLGVAEEQLAQEMKIVHQRHHNSEQPFGLLEAKSVVETYGHLDRHRMAQEMDEAFHAFNSKRKSLLLLYPGVQDALTRLKDSNATVVGHTEATVPNALFRLQFLNIGDCLQKLYAVEPSGEGHPDPAKARGAGLPNVPVRYLRQDERKPDPQVLADICADFNVPPSRALYVGDSISRDIGMAKEAGVWSAWAKYGTQYDKQLWEQLVRVTHWTAEDVRRAEEAREKYGHTEPDAILERSFDEVFEHFSIGK